MVNATFWQNNHFKATRVVANSFGQVLTAEKKAEKAYDQKQTADSRFCLTGVVYFKI